MRSTLTILLAFAAGVLVMLWLPRPGTPWLPNHHPADLPPASAGIPPKASYAAGAEADSEGDDWPVQGPTPEQVLYAQPRLLRDALARVSPRVAGKPNLYLLTFAGDGAEDVFHNEAEYAAKLFTTRFGATAHSLVLENNPVTLSNHPLASWSNLDAALAGLGKLMRPEQDILLLYISSHGSEDHTLLVDMDPLPLDQIDARDLAGILAMHPFKWKVVVINACYSGGFVPLLRAPDTLVLAAARTDRSSFGCGSDSNITYFGKAWLVDALNHTDNFVDAFRQASSEISRWEKLDKLPPSEPQIDIGSGIENQLALWRMGVTPGSSSVPFTPANPASATSTTSP